jgi:hypothetical protein
MSDRAGKFHLWCLSRITSVTQHPAHSNNTGGNCCFYSEGRTYQTPTSYLGVFTELFRAAGVRARLKRNDPWKVKRNASNVIALTLKCDCADTMNVSATALRACQTRSRYSTATFKDQLVISWYCFLGTKSASSKSTASVKCERRLDLF